MSAGYAFVPLPDHVRRTEREHAVLHRRMPGALFGRIYVVFCTAQPVHIGSGRKRLHAGKAIRAGARVQGRPGIPGASLKGVLRSRYEAITRSCIAMPGKREERIHSSTGVERARLVGKALAPLGTERCELTRSSRHLCPACALFGRMSLRSRVTVTDLASPEHTSFAIDSMLQQFGPNLHHVGPCRLESDHRGQIFEVHDVHGRKHAVGMGPVPTEPRYEHIEVIPADSLLAGALRLFNVLPEELGGLLVALGRQPASALKIGGGKGRGFGRMALVHMKCELRDAAGAIVAAGEDNEAAWRTCFEESPDHWRAGGERLVRIHQGDC